MPPKVPICRTSRSPTRPLNIVGDTNDTSVRSTRLVMMDPVAPVSKIASVGYVRAWWPVWTDDVMYVTAHVCGSGSSSYILLKVEVKGASSAVAMATFANFSELAACFSWHLDSLCPV